MKKWLGFLLCLVVLHLPVAGWAATSTGCDNEDNGYIVPELALCSTHVFNIGRTTNPTSDDERGYMRDVVALKTELMTQQMNKQYEYLESMIRRFKTQLEKAVLQTRLQTSGAGGDDSSSGSSSSFKSNDRNIFISGVENCNTKLLPADVLTCLSSNLNTMSNMTGNGSEVSREVTKQFVNDFNVLIGTYTKSACEGAGLKKNSSGTYDCGTESYVRKKKNFQSCMDGVRSCIRDKMYSLNLEAQQNNK